MSASNSLENSTNLIELNNEKFVQIISILQENVKQLETQNQLLHIQNEKMNSKIIESEKNLQDLDAQVSHITNQKIEDLLKGLRPQIKSLYETLQKQQINSKNQVTKSLNELKENTDTKFIAIQGEVNQKMASVQESQSSVQSTSRKMEHIKEEISTLANQIQNVKQQIEQAHIVELPNELKEKMEKQFTAHREETDKKIASIKENQSSVQSTSREMEHIKEEISTLANQIQDVKQQKEQTHIVELSNGFKENIEKQFTAHREETDKKIASIKKNQSSVQSASGEIQEMKKQLTVHKGEVDTKIASIKENQSSVQSASSEIQEMKKQISSIEKQQSLYDNRSTDQATELLSKFKEEMNEQLAEIDKKISMNNENIQETKDKLTNYSSDNVFHRNSSIQKFSSVDKELKEINEKSVKTHYKVDSLKSDLKSCTENVDSLSKIIATMTKDKLPKDSPLEIVASLPEKKIDPSKFASKSEENEQSSSIVPTSSEGKKSIFTQMFDYFSPKNDDSSEQTTAVVPLTPTPTPTPTHTQLSENKVVGIVHANDSEIGLLSD